MGATLSRAATTTLFTVSAIILVLHLSACSMAGRAVVAGHPSPTPGARAHAGQSAPHALDLMPSSPPRSGRDADQLPNDPTASAQVSPDGSRVAFESDRDGVHGVWIARRDGEGARRVSGSRVAVRPAWSPDGERLAFLARPQKRDEWSLWVADAAGEGPPRKLGSAEAGVRPGFAWFPDNRQICYGSEGWLIVVDTTAVGTRAFRLPTESSRIAGVPAVSPDGRSVVFAVAGEGAWLVSMRDGSMTQLASERDVDAFAWAPGGRQVAFRTARDGQWRVQTVKNER